MLFRPIVYLTITFQFFTMRLEMKAVPKPHHKILSLVNLYLDLRFKKIVPPRLILYHAYSNYSIPSLKAYPTLKIMDRSNACTLISQLCDLCTINFNFASTPVYIMKLNL